MRIFISWSGDRSKDVATALADWIPYVIPEAKPWISVAHIKPGVRWVDEVSQVLASTKLGILCVTRDNVAAPWMLFEAGCIARELNASRIIPYLLDLAPDDIGLPLAQFQTATASREGTWRLVQSLNEVAAEPQTESRLSTAYEVWWKRLEPQLVSIPTAAENVTRAVRTDRELLEELLALTRQGSRQPYHGSRDALSPRKPREGVRAVIYWHDQGFDESEARTLAAALEDTGLPCTLAPHIDPRQPDAIFIGALVGADDAQAVIRLLPYQPRFLFRPDYPTPEGGDDSGLVIGVGYMSEHYKASRGSRSEPVAISKAEWDYVAEAGISNVEFQRRLREITWRQT